MTIGILEITAIDEGLDDYSQRPGEGVVQEAAKRRGTARSVGASHHAACSARRLISCVTSSR